MTLVAIDDASPQTTISYIDETANRLKFMQIQSGTGLFSAGNNVGGFEFDMGRTIELVTDITHASGFESAKFGQSSPKVSCAPVMVPVATRNHLAILVSGTTESNSFTLGTVAGKKATFTWPLLETVSASDDARGVAKTWGLTCNAVRGAGAAVSNAWSIAFT
jgi:hypothetical protein